MVVVSWGNKRYIEGIHHCNKTAASSFGKPDTGALLSDRCRHMHTGALLSDKCRHMHAYSPSYAYII